MATATPEKPVHWLALPFEWLGRLLLGALNEVGAFFLFLKETFYWTVHPPFRSRLLFQQLEFIGNQSLNIILISAIALGAVFGLQIGGIFQFFKAESLMGAATAKAFCQELGPLVTTTLLTGRAGSAMTAEISTMKVGEQVEAMEAMAVSPVSYLVVPRVLASVIITPLLCGVFIFVGVLGAYFAGIVLFDVDEGLFVEKMTRFVQPRDIWRGLTKAVVFSVIMASLSCRFGLQASGGAKGVGRATTNSVVTILLAVLGVDVVITYIQVTW